MVGERRSPRDRAGASDPVGPPARGDGSGNRGFSRTAGQAPGEAGARDRSSSAPGPRGARRSPEVPGPGDAGPGRCGRLLGSEALQRESRDSPGFECNPSRAAPVPVVGGGSGWKARRDRASLRSTVPRSRRSPEQLAGDATSGSACERGPKRQRGRLAPRPLARDESRDASGANSARVLLPRNTSTAFPPGRTKCAQRRTPEHATRTKGVRGATRLARSIPLPSTSRSHASPLDPTDSADRVSLARRGALGGGRTALDEPATGSVGRRGTRPVRALPVVPAEPGGAHRAPRASGVRTRRRGRITSVPLR